MVSKISRSRSDGDAGWLTRRWRCRGHALRTLKSSNVHRLRSSNAFSSKISNLRRRFVNTKLEKSFFYCFIFFDVNNLLNYNSLRESTAQDILLRHRDVSSFIGRARSFREFPAPAQLFRRQSWLPSSRAICCWPPLTSELLVDHPPVAQHQLRPVLLGRVVLVPRHDDKVLAKVDEAIVVSRVIHFEHLNLSQKNFMRPFSVISTRFLLHSESTLLFLQRPSTYFRFFILLRIEKALFLRCWQ